MPVMEKIDELMNDKEFVEKLYACRELPEMQQLFAQNGLVLSDEEMEDIGATLKNAANHEKKNGPVNDEELENVSGGMMDFGAVAAKFGKEGMSWLINEIRSNYLKIK